MGEEGDAKSRIPSMVPPERPHVQGGVRGPSSIGINRKLIRNASQTLPTRPTESESGFSETLGDSCAH